MSTRSVARVELNVNVVGDGLEHFVSVRAEIAIQGLGRGQRGQRVRSKLGRERAAAVVEVVAAEALIGRGCHPQG